MKNGGPPQKPAQPSAAPLSQKDQQCGQAQGPAQGIQIHLGVWEVMAKKADAAQRGQHQGKDGQGSERQPGVPPASEALPQKSGGEQKAQDKAERGGNGRLEALGNEAALIGVAAAQRYAAEVDGGLRLRNLLFPQAGGLPT